MSALTFNKFYSANSPLNLAVVQACDKGFATRILWQKTLLPVHYHAEPHGYLKLGDTVLFCECEQSIILLARIITPAQHNSLQMNCGTATLQLDKHGLIQIKNKNAVLQFTPSGCVNLTNQSLTAHSHGDCRLQGSNIFLN